MKSKAETAPAALPKAPLGKRLKDNWQLYLLLLIPVILTFIYKYIPMYGIQIAFRDYKASRGILGSRWVGIAGGELPDAFQGVGFTNYELANYGADGTFIDLTPYINEEIMPNLTKILEEYPGIRLTESFRQV